jgi:hypothetical protein
MSAYIPKNFSLEELIPPELFEKWKDVQWKVWQSADDRALITLQNLRKRYGSIMVNDWHTGGTFRYRGLRPMDYQGLTYLSQHKWFKAYDCSFANESEEKVRQDILADPFHEDFKHITCLEMRVSWLHFDVRNWDKANYGIFKVYLKQEG